MSALLSKYDVIKGDINAYSEEELKFIKFVADKFHDLREVILVDSRGYRDIWFVFDELGFEKSTGIISECFDYFDNTGQKEMEYLLLTPEGIIYEALFPLVMLKLRDIL